MSGLAPRPCDIFSWGQAITLPIRYPCVDSGLSRAIRPVTTASRIVTDAVRFGSGSARFARPRPQPPGRISSGNPSLWLEFARTTGRRDQR